MISHTFAPKPKEETVLQVVERGYPPRHARASFGRGQKLDRSGGPRGGDSVTTNCRRQAIAESLYYGWSKEFLEAGNKRLSGDIACSVTGDEVKALRKKSRDPTEAQADRSLENRLLKRALSNMGRRRLRCRTTEKLEIIRLVEQSRLSVRQTLDKLGIPKPTFFR
ncbi:hypothetical protein [Rhizobium sp. CAU 1783]